MGNKVEVTICGSRYKLVSSDNDPEQLQSLAEDVDKRIQATREKLRISNKADVCILAMLQLAEEYEKLKGEYKALVEIE